MKDIFVIDNFIDDREFRNYIYSILVLEGFTNIVIDDVRLSDNDEINNNDILAEKDGIKYTIQTFLNIDITRSQVEETIDDIEKESVTKGLIITNKVVSDDIKKYAHENLIEIWDRSKLEK